MNDLFDSDEFEPSTAAAHARVAAVRPAAYARTRNALDGEVTRLSPYLTHGFITLPEALAGVLQRGPLPVEHKLVYEFAWREYFHHVWAHEGEGIFESLHEGVLPDAAYAHELPADIRQGATGVPVIDQAVRTLYATGYLHNHARMWLASYVVHLRKVFWRAGADWLYGHLLDGDLASNHLSWQWVAGTGSHKPYLFNAENVERYAPTPWHSRGTVIDTDYDSLDRMARSPRAVPGGRGVPVAEPPLSATPPLALGALFSAPDAGVLQGQAVRVLHAWDLAAPPPATAGLRSVAVFDAAFHRRWPWNERRWHFVSAGLQGLAPAQRWWGEAAELVPVLQAAAACSGTHSAHLGSAWAGLPWRAVPRLFRAPAFRAASFSKFFATATRGLRQAAELAAG
ncbi:deoxyribodipyrimidine photolyase [beta proteobacterium AAP121]|nr:deoxyribodipyrimidine photolyase [beta proteobacterium AAP65]KPF99216.1 deoxyribodipyrimidine photolyase [beta proteobacterium AAP121]